MKKVFLMIALCALTMSSQAAFRRYLCGITELTVDTLQSNTKNQFTVTFDQKCKNTAEYSKPETYYTSTVKLVLNSNDRTLEGVYTTQGASTTSSSANENDQTINLITSEFTSDSTSRLLRKDSISTFTIEKVDETHYAITTGLLYFSKRLDQTTDTWAYQYSYDADEILTQGINPTPYIFGYDGEYHEAVYNYDMTVNGISVVRDDSDYDATRYFLTLSCVGKNRDNNVERNYEVQLAIYPTSASIVGSFATQGSGTLLYASNSYVKDLKINKQRYLANDSLRTIQIKSKGTNQYSFYGGTLTCTDIDMNYSAVYGKKRIEAVHYYHFSDNDGEGISFGFDESSTEMTLTANDITVEPFTEGGEIDHFDLTLQTKNENNANYEVSLSIISDALAGSFSTTGETLSLWSSVNYGTTYSYCTGGSVVTINAKGNGVYTISANLLCENGYTYKLNAFDFSYQGIVTGVQNTEYKVQTQKAFRDGQIIIIRDGKEFNAQGASL